MSTPIITVKLWGTIVGYIGYEPGDKTTSIFSYDPSFLYSGIQMSPIVMRTPRRDHTFPNISQRTFHGLSGIFADSLPDKFGNKLIDLYFSDKGFDPLSITALDRLAYIGKRSMGAFEYEPSHNDFTVNDGGYLDIHHLNELANMVLARREEFANNLSKAQTRSEEMVLIRIGSSAGGARAKALVARDETGKFFDGTMDVGADKRYWLLKFDTSNNSDNDAKPDPKGMPRVEYIYSVLARECGINIPETDYVIDGDDFHFMIERFDREVVNGSLQKKHYASWAGISHYDRDNTGTYSYTQLLATCKEIGLRQDTLDEVYRRTVFNIIGRNQDDHTKNFGFLMDRKGGWSLSPAFDLTYAYDPYGKWTKEHQLKLYGKGDYFDRSDLLKFANACNINEKRANLIIEKTRDVFSGFNAIAIQYGVDSELRETVVSNLRVSAFGKLYTQVPDGYFDINNNSANESNKINADIESKSP